MVAPSAVEPFPAGPESTPVEVVTQPEPDAVSLSSMAAFASAPADPLWLHRELASNSARSLLDETGLADGVFLVKASTVPGSYVLDLLAKGVLTHHMIKEDQLTGRLTLNGEIVNTASTVAELIDWLAEPQVEWPCVLTDFVPNGRSAGDSQPTSNSMASYLATSKSKESNVVPVVDEVSTAADGVDTGMTGTSGGRHGDTVKSNKWKCGNCGVYNINPIGQAAESVSFDSACQEVHDLPAGDTRW